MAKKTLTPATTRTSQIPFGSSELMRANFNQMMKNMWSNWNASDWWGQGGSFVPAIETKENGSVFTVTAELPGLSEKDVEVTLSENNDMLVISGEKRNESEEKDEENNYYHLERSYGSFRRSVPVPFAVVSDSVKAKFKNGVLEVTMEKDGTSPEMKARSIQIEA